MYRLYAKHKTMSRFKPVDYNNCIPVNNILRATLFAEAELPKLKQELKLIQGENPEYKFEIRKVSNK